MKNKDLIAKAAQLRISVLEALKGAGFGFLGGNMSVMEILVSLYYGELQNEPVMNFNPQNPGWPSQDYLVLSKGHSALSLYAILADLGFFDKAELDFVGKLNAKIKSRPFNKVPGVSVSSYYPGSGLSNALGIALALNSEKKDSKVFTVIGDSELQSGKVWEAAAAASHHKLRNMVLFIDNNGHQESGRLRSVMDIGSILGKFDAFGWRVLQVRDGHDFDEILSAIHKSYSTISKPICIWCHTVKGKGIDFAEGKEGYHSAILSEQEMSVVIPKLEKIWKAI